MPLPIDFAKLSAQDVLDVAAFIEREAQERYTSFADHLASAGEADAARFFRQMADLEAAHGEQVKRRRGREFGGLPAHLRDVVLWDVEGPALDRDVTHLTLADAIAIALASEARARDFFAGATEFFVDAPTRRVLDDLCRDEIGHIALIEDYRARVAAGSTSRA